MDMSAILFSPAPVRCEVPLKNNSYIFLKVVLKYLWRDTLGYEQIPPQTARG